MDSRIVQANNNYGDLLCYKKAVVIYDLAYYFCSRYVNKHDRTYDQIIQAARSGKQNIIEGYSASATSAETELKLLNVAKSSLKELLADYEDYLRTRNLRIWEENSIEFTTAQELGKTHNDTAYWMNIVRTRSDETIANIAIILLHQTDYLIYRFMENISSRFTQEGGFREKLSRVRHNKIKSK